MPLSPGDDFLLHQHPATIDTVSTSDRHFYDRYYFNMHPCSDELFLVAGLGQYPNLGVTDAFVTISHGSKQYTVRGSRELGSDRLDSSVGPIRIEVVEGLKALRVICEPNEWGIAMDVTFTGTVDALEEPQSTTFVGQRQTQDTCRLAQVGTYSGTLEVAGQHYEVTPDTWWGARDHSWGYRHGLGEPEAPGIKNSLRSSYGFFHNWMPMQFDDHMIKITIDEDHAGNRVLDEAEQRWNVDSDGEDRNLGRPEVAIDYHPGTREMAAAEVWFTGERSSDVRVTNTPLRTVYLKHGSGYIYDGYWGHGVYQGDLVVEGVETDVGQPIDRLDLAYLNETLCRYETSDGRIGYGMHENMCAGLHIPSGFDSPTAMG